METMLESYEVRQKAMDAHRHEHEHEHEPQVDKMLSTSQVQVPHDAEDEKMAWKLYHQVNGLRKRSRNMDTHADEVEEARPKVSKQSRASKPLMVFHQGTQLWYR